MFICIYLFLAGQSTLFDRDEPRFSRAAVEMVETGDYLVPHFNEELRPDKPILIYWLMAIPISLLGPTDFACRAVSPLAVGLTCLATFWIGRRLYGPRAGLLAMTVLAASPLLIQDGQAAIADATLLACLTLTLAAYVRTLGRAVRWSDVGLIGLALGLAMLTKGPVALIAVLGIGLHRLLPSREGEAAIGQSRLGASVMLLLAAGLGFVLFAAWGIPAVLSTPELMEEGLYEHFVARIWKAREGHGGSGLLSYLALLVSFYPLTVLLGFFPWVGFLPAALRRSPGDSRQTGDARLLLLCWSGVFLVIMSLVSTKLPHYVLPMWPAMALLVGHRLDQWMSQPRDAAERAAPWPGLRLGMALLVIGALVIGVPALAAGLAGPAAAQAAVASYEETGEVFGQAAKQPVHGEWVDLLEALRPAAVAIGVAAFAPVGVALWALRRRRAGLALGGLLVGMGVSLAALGLLGLPAFEQFKLAPPLARAIDAHTPGDVPIATVNYNDPSLVFYTGRTPVLSLDSASPGGIKQWRGEATAGVLVIDREQVASLVGDPLPAGLRMVEPLAHRRLDSSGRWRNLVLVLRHVPGISDAQH